MEGKTHDENYAAWLAGPTNFNTHRSEFGVRFDPPQAAEVVHLLHKGRIAEWNAMRASTNHTRIELAEVL